MIYTYDYETYQDLEKYCSDDLEFTLEALKPTASELIENDVKESLSTIHNFIDKITAEHLREFLKGSLPDGVLNYREYLEQHPVEFITVTGERHLLPGRIYRTVEINVTENELKNYEYLSVISLNSLGLTGKWIVKEINVDYNYRIFCVKLEQI